MGYHIQLYRKEVKAAHQASGQSEFFENPANLTDFTPEQKEKLQKRLASYGYQVTREEKDRTFYEHHKEASAEALLTGSGLYFTARGEAIFEISMTSSEFTDSGEFAKYDPQNSGWEE